MKMGEIRMSKFLHSRPGGVAEDEIISRNTLTTAAVRSQIAGNFFLWALHLPSYEPCFLVMHEKGLFVLLQCHQNGLIHGRLYDAQWENFNYLGDSTPFANPISACRQIVATLAQGVKLPEEAFRSCILFDVESEFRQIPPDSNQFALFRVDQLEAYFSQLSPTLAVQYSPAQLSALHDIFTLVFGQGE